MFFSIPFHYIILHYTLSYQTVSYTIIPTLTLTMLYFLTLHFCWAAWPLDPWDSISGLKSWLATMQMPRSELHKWGQRTTGHRLLLWGIFMFLGESVFFRGDPPLTSKNLPESNMRFQSLGSWIGHACRCGTLLRHCCLKSGTRPNRTARPPPPVLCMRIGACDRYALF